MNPEWTPARAVYAEPAAYWLIELRCGQVPLGDVQWFFEEGPFYPHIHNKRLGAFEKLESAKSAVEQRCLRPVT